jgi:hypothetical protein
MLKCVRTTFTDISFLVVCADYMKIKVVYFHDYEWLILGFEVFEDYQWKKWGFFSTAVGWSSNWSLWTLPWNKRGVSKIYEAAVIEVGSISRPLTIAVGVPLNHRRGNLCVGGLAILRRNILGQWKRLQPESEVPEDYKWMKPRCVRTTLVEGSFLVVYTDNVKI